MTLFKPLNFWFLRISGVLVLLVCGPIDKCIAAKAPVLRVLVLEARQMRLRADGDVPLRVRGVGSRERRISALKVRVSRNQLQFAFNGKVGPWTASPRNAVLKISSNDRRGIWLGKRRYRGELRIVLKDGRINVVNYVDIEKYLPSVVGSEMPKSWPIAALQAQAIAARTYALKKFGKPGIFDIRATEKSQVYLGIESETQSTKKAVNSTRSLVLLHQGKLINAVFHSSSGGKTEASGSVWKKQLPYLVSATDYDHHSPVYKWRREFTPGQLKVAFKEIGGLKSFEVLKKSDTDRLLALRAYGPKGDIWLSGKELRRRLGLRSTRVRLQMSSAKPSRNGVKNYSSSLFFSNKESPSKDEPIAINSQRRWSSVGGLPLLSEVQNLPSLPPSVSIRPPLQSPPPLFDLDPPSPLPSIPRSMNLSVIGFGSGHGVGMSQWGAHGMAQEGASFRRILFHYYKGVDIRPYSSI